MVPEKLINDFVTRLRQAAGANLESIVLYGSAASGDYDPELSNLNLLYVLKDAGYASLRSVSAVMEWWYGKKQVAPLIMSKKELLRSADVFSIELMDMKQHYRILFGEDILAPLTLRLDQHRIQLEYELREKLLLLRQSLLLAASSQSRLWDVLLGSVASFTTLFRHALIALGDSAPESKRDSVEQLGQRLNCETSVFLKVLDVREHKLERKQVNVQEITAQYLTVVEQVTAAVDRMLGTAATPGRS